MPTTQHAVGEVPTDTLEAEIVSLARWLAAGTYELLLLLLLLLLLVGEFDHPHHDRPTALRMYNACMPNVQVRGVPDDVHAALVRKAEFAGQSLQQFLAAQLAAIATSPTVDEILDRLDHLADGQLSAHDAIEALGDERARR